MVKLAETIILRCLKSMLAVNWRRMMCKISLLILCSFVAAVGLFHMFGTNYRPNFYPQSNSNVSVGVQIYDSIGSAFNLKDVMQCPDCQKVEKGQWLYTNGSRSIGSAFNSKGVMQCPDCQKVEKGQWLYTNGSRSYPEFKTKFGGNSGALGDSITITHDKNKITITFNGQFSKRYLKYLTKKYLEKHNARDWLRLVASNRDSNLYDLWYFYITENEGEDKE